MPSGATHNLIAVIASPPLLALTSAGLAWGLGAPPLVALHGGLLLTASHLACSHWLSPDLDLAASMQDERWGVLRPIWRPYERLIPHRHWLSHSGFSALLRLVYLFLALNVVLLGVSLLMLAQAALVGLLVADTPTSAAVGRWLLEQYLVFASAGLRLVAVYPLEATLLLVGALASDVLHTSADYIDTRRKRRKRRRRQHELLRLMRRGRISFNRRLGRVRLVQLRPQHQRYKRSSRPVRR
jgi:uncharacterized metal-binding protein